MPKPFVVRLTCLAVLLPLMIGCDSRTATVPVSGVVLVDDKPAADVRLNFQPISGGETGPGSVGTTDAEGKFTLTTVESDPRSGAMPGKHTVRLQWLNPANFDAEEGERITRSEAPFKLPKEAYNGIEFTVPDGGTDAADFKF